MNNKVITPIVKCVEADKEGGGQAELMSRERSVVQEVMKMLRVCFM